MTTKERTEAAAVAVEKAMAEARAAVAVLVERVGKLGHFIDTRELAEFTGDVCKARETLQRADMMWDEGVGL